VVAAGAARVATFVGWVRRATRLRRHRMSDSEISLASGVLGGQFGGAFVWCGCVG
jgi:hypothetical protein